MIDPNAALVKCDNCGFTAPDDDPRWAEIADLSDRVEPGGEMPAAQCPTCGCLAYLVAEDDPPAAPLDPLPAADQLAAALDHGRRFAVELRAATSTVARALVIAAAEQDELRAMRRDLALARGTLDACLHVLLDPDTGEWRELRSCADAVEALSEILDRYRTAMETPFS